MLLELEEKLKNELDEGITIWLEPVGDKSKLRNLRGINIDNKESFLMCLLGYTRFFNIENNIPSVTGAVNKVVCGEIYE